MKARILAVALLALGASVASAQTPATTTAPKAGHGKWKGDHGDKGKKEDADEANEAGERGDRGRGWGRGGANTLKGITLTADQKTRVEGIRQSYRPKMMAVRDSMKANRDAGVKPTAGDPLMAHAKAIATQEQGEIRAVLTADQQVIYDKNVAQMKDRMAKREARGKGDR